MLSSEQYIETPYIYQQTFTQNYTNVGPTIPDGITNGVIKSDGDSDFFMRRALGPWNFQDSAGRYFVSGNGSSAQGLEFANTTPMIEKLYPLGTSIPFQILTSGGLYLAANTFLSFPGAPTAHVNIAQVLFQGVKRYKGTPARDPGYRYKERDYTYTVQFNLNWTYLQAPYTSFAVASPRTFIQLVNDYDFELHAIECDGDYVSSTYPGGLWGGYGIKLYDPNGYALMNDYVHFRYLSYVGGYNQVAAPPVGGQLAYSPNCFPCPPLVYPRTSSIRFDVQSFLDTGTGGSRIETIHFRGVRRIPC